MNIFRTKYTDEIDQTRHKISFFIDLSFVKVLSVERTRIDTAREVTVITYFTTSRDEPRELWLQCSRREHELIAQSAFNFQSEKHKTNT